MQAEITLLFLRALTIGALYVFLLLIVLVVARDLRRGVPSADGSSSPVARLVVASADPSVSLSASEFDLLAETTIGRDNTAVISLPDSFVSGIHARVTYSRGRWWIEDLGSTNGTKVRGMSVTRLTRLSYGDIVDIGRVRLRLQKG